MNLLKRITSYSKKLESEFMLESYLLYNEFTNSDLDTRLICHSRGQFAVVRKCVEQKTGAEYAAKIMRKRRVARGVAAADIGTATK